MGFVYKELIAVPIPAVFNYSEFYFCIFGLYLKINRITLVNIFEAKFIRNHQAELFYIFSIPFPIDY